MDIKKFLSKVNFNSLVDLTEYVFLNFVKDCKNQDEIIDNLITYFEWNFKTDRTFEIKESIPNKNYEDNYNKAAGILNPAIENLIAKNPQHRDFYVEIWEMLSNKNLFVDDDDVIGALIFIENHDKIPYFNLEPPIEVSEEEFSSLLNDLNMEIQKSMYIFNRGYEYRTEVASQLLRLLEALPDEKHKIVYLSGLLHYHEWLCSKSDEEDEQTDKEENDLSE